MKNNEDITMLVCCHKKDYFRSGDGFMPIHVGKAISTVDLGIEGDNTGDNISIKNPNYCELTAHYWYWKNGKKTRYVGLSHYRRYFDFRLKLAYGIRFKDVTSDMAIADPPKLPVNTNRIFEKYDIILAKRKIYPFSLKIDYWICHIAEDYDVLRNVIKDKSPEMLFSFDAVMEHNNKMSPCNMFLTTWNVFDEYSKWLFDILFEVERRVRISENPVQARVFGFMAERLLNVYCHYKKFRIKYVPFIMVNDNPIEKQSTLRALRDQFIYMLQDINYIFKK